MTSDFIEIESHPLEPFLPKSAKLLMLGSFPPPRKRWSTDFYYPNFQNDMWRIFGIIFKGDKNAFVDLMNKKFKKVELIDFLNDKGIAIYDTATRIKRLSGNASDAALEVVEPTNVPELLHNIPQCTAIVTTGQKATDTLCNLFRIQVPQIGRYASFIFEDRSMKLYRMPSSSRAYPLKLQDKSIFYETMFKDLGFL